jgi:folate-binding protein YgfZ
MTEIVLHDSSAAAKPQSGSAGAEFHILLSGCGVWNLSGRATIALTGSDRVRWLNGMVTNNIRDLQPGYGVYAFLLSPQGRILGDLYAFNRGESLRVNVDTFLLAKTLEIFDRYIIMDDVEVKDLSAEVAGVAVAGPKAAEVLAKAGFLTPQLSLLQFADVTSQPGSLTVVRGDNPAVPWFELWTTPANLGTVRNALESAGGVAVGAEALEWLRIASGVPRYGQDIRERDLPQETGQERALNFSKGCYIGQEIVERIRSRGNVHRMLTGFVIDGPLPPAESKIQADGKDAGEITSAVSLPLTGGERKVALGYIRREIAAAKKPLQAGEATATVTELPFAGIFQEAA